MIRGLYCKKKLEIRCQSVSRRLSVYFLSRYFQIFGIFVGIDHHFTQDKTGFIIACLLSISVSATKNWHKPLQDRDRLWWQFGDFMFSLIKKKDNWKMCKVLKHTERTLVLRLYSIHFEINGNPCNLIGSHWYDLFTNLIFSCIFYPTSKEALLKYNNEQISRKWKTTFVTFSKPAHYWINKTFVQT